MAHSKQQILLGRDSNSSGTSPSIFVGDCRLLSVSVQTSTGSASNITISLSNDDGFQESIAFWSAVTTLPARGIYTIDPGFRWLRAERANIAMGSSASNTTVLLNRYYE
jgi:hypothetical protein